eukprot:14719163-Ditylum_brightwellii.AAC.1
MIIFLASAQCVSKEQPLVTIVYYCLIPIILTLFILHFSLVSKDKENLKDGMVVNAGVIFIGGEANKSRAGGV